MSLGKFVKFANYTLYRLYFQKNYDSKFITIKS